MVIQFLAILRFVWLLVLEKTEEFAYYFVG
jgi:hypothetical protein